MTDFKLSFPGVLFHYNVLFFFFLHVALLFPQWQMCEMMLSPFISGLNYEFVH